MKKTNSGWPLDFFGTTALLVVVCSAYFAFTYAQQPPLDLHAFRQTQTALTAYWFTQEGFKWVYETPVGGAPWAIPYEFPLYQLIVSWFSQAFGVSLDFAGRVTSYLFLLLCLFPARSVTKRLDLPGPVFSFFVAMLLSMPLYLYWGRSFMIETAALFFTIAAIKYFIDYLSGDRSLRVALLFVLSSCLAILQKTTTMLPVLGILSVVFMISEICRAKATRSAVFGRDLFAVAMLFAIPVAVGAGWVLFTDRVKLLNPLGRELTSAALSAWNWGTVSQRLSSDIWVKVVWERILVPNMAGIIGLLLLLLPFFVRVHFKVRAIALGALALGLVPLFLFTNLHLVHDYYQTAIVIFFAYGMAVALGAVILPKFGRIPAMAAMLVILASNYFSLMTGYFPHMQTGFSKGTRDLAIGGVLNRDIPAGMQFVAFGNDWSSTFAYIAERKSFTVPEWFAGYDEVATHPEKFVDEGRLGAIVSCPVRPRKNAFDPIFWAGNGRSWRVGETRGCQIALPEKQLDAALLKPIECSGDIESAEVQNRSGQLVVSIAGWTATPGEKPTIPDDVFLKMSRSDGETVYLQALKVPRFPANRLLGIPYEVDVGFSRLLSAAGKRGDYEIEIIQYAGGQYGSCGIAKMIHIE